MPLTKDAVFFDAFSAHAACTVRAAGLLVEMLRRPGEAEALAQRIKDIEAEGDKITHDVVLALHQTWITPLDREEIHVLISRLDDVLDYIEAASERIALYEIAEATPESIELARVIEATAKDLAQALSHLSGFKQPKLLLDLCVAINQHENEADRVFRGALARLFRERWDPLLVMKWRDIYDAMETATDRAEDVANVIEGIVLEHG